MRQMPLVGRPAPTFRLASVDGRKRTLPAEATGRRIALFFFCGCSWCADVAREWSALQRGRALSPRDPKAKSPLTVVVFSGSAAEVQTLARESGLDLRHTWLLPDPDLQVTQGLYHAEPCPRVFMIDEKGIVRYINAGPDDIPREAPAAVIAAKTLGALRANR